MRCGIKTAHNRAESNNQFVRQRGEMSELAEGARLEIV
jgi:hypothetical protein